VQCLEAVREAEVVITDFLEKTGVAEYLESEEGFVSLDEAVQIALTNEGQVVGVTGKPATGKSTFCRYLLERREVVVIDEFWKAGSRTTYGNKLKLAEEAKKRGQLVVAAACQIDPNIADIRIHLVSPPEIRRHHLIARHYRPSDEHRLRFFEAYEAHDDLLFGLERMKAQVVVESNRVRY
tara:strand:+ start:1006 stop:1548 length:543 start_codon:yes stop_codon:yes gene_type:complete